MRIGICDDIREEVEKQEKQVRQITYQIGIRADIRKCYSGMNLLMEIELSGQFDIILLDIGKYVIICTLPFKKTCRPSGRHILFLLFGSKSFR